MIKQFDSSYAGHIDMENVGYLGTPVNDRKYRVTLRLWRQATNASGSETE